MTDLRERLGRLPLERRAKFLTLLRVGTHAGSGERLTPRPRTLPAPLSHAQNLLWFVDRVSPGQATYNLMFCFRLRGPLDAAAFKGAFDDVVARHEPLRTMLPEVEAGPVQVVVPAHPVWLPVTTVDGVDVEARRDRCRTLAGELANLPFDLARGPLWRAALYRVDPDEHLFAFIVHHVIFDGLSAEVFVRDLAELYRARLTATPADLPELPIQYIDFAHWERERLTGAFLERLVRYWTEQLRDPPLLDLPTDRPRPPELTFRGANAIRPLAAETVTAAEQFAHAIGTTTYPVYLAAFVALLQRYGGDDDLVVGCSTAVRARPELENLLGFFVNMLALRVNAGGSPTFRELVRRADAVIKQAFTHIDLPFERVVKAVAPVRDPSRSPLVQVAFLAGQVPRLPEFAGLDVTFEQLETRTAKFDMTWQVLAAGDESTVSVEYSTDLFNESTMDTMLTRFGTLLAGLLAAPDRPVPEADLMSPAERADLVRRWPGPSRPVRGITVHGWFAEQAARTPTETAVVAGAARLTFDELNRAANRLAGLLRRHGAGPEQRVALCLPRGADYAVAALAVLKAGAGFVPLDPAHPADRLAALLADARPCAVITDAARAAGLPGPGLDGTAPGRIVLEEVADQLASGPADDPPELVGPDNLAYVIYTSGSTGTPKGVEVEHRNVVNFVESVRDLFGLGPADRILGYASYGFDVSIFEMFGALLNGARLHVALDSDRLNLDRLQDLLESAGITVIDLPPSVMALLEPERLTSLRVAFVGGEAFPGELVNRWNKVSRFLNGYGPTECTVTMIVQDCEGHWDTSPPIGLPMANHVAHVLDGDLRPVADGIPGELVIGGAGLARGYLNQPGLTDEKFIADPFGTAPGGRLYRTGDLVKRQPDGALVFLGRLDRQVKIRGIRIEPAEIESVLAAHPDVRQVLVEPWTNPAGQRHLVAYVAAPGGAATVGDLHGHASAKLPTALVPSHIVILDELPLTTSGKVDRRALPAPDAAATSAPAITAPRGETERVLAEEIVGPLFATATVDVTANFFELGGSSLQAAALLSGIRRRFEVEVSVADFFRDPTIAGLALVIERQRAVALDDDGLLDLIEGMPDDLVERLIESQRAKGLT